MNEVERVALDLELANSRYDDLVAAQDYPGIVAMMRERPLVDNPEVQRTIPKRYTRSALFSVLHEDDRPAVRQIPAWQIQDIDDALAANDRDTLNIHLAILADLLPNSIAAFGAALAQTELDSSYQAQIRDQSVEDALGFRVTEHDIQAVLA